MSPPRPERSRDLMAVIHRRAWLTTKVFVVLAAAVIAGVFLYPATYRAEAVVQLPSAADARLAVTRLSDRATIETLLHSFRLAAEGIDESQGFDRAVAAMASRLHIESVAADTLRLSFDASDGTTARQIVERLSQMALAAAAPTPATAGARFLDAELAEADTLLATQQERLEAYHQRHPNEDASHLEEASQSLLRVQAESQALSIAITRDRQRLQTRPQVSAFPATVDVRPDAATADPLMPELIAARAMLTDLLTRLTPAHPDVARQQDVIKDLETRIAARAAAPPAPRAFARGATDEEAMALSQRISANEAQRRRVINTIARLRATLDNAPEAQAELIALTRDYEAVQRLRASLAAKSEAMAAEVAARMSVGRLLTPARVPDRSSSPDRRKVLAVGLAAALLVALLAGTIQEFRDTRVHDQDDLGSLSDVPLLAVVNEVVTLEQAARRRIPAFFRALVGPALAAVIALAWWWAK